MRVAAVYDIHGNLPALDAVLREIEQESVDLILVGGDIVWGPFPRETLDILLRLDRARFIRGNADREVATRLDTAADGLEDDITAAINIWAADQLTEEDSEWLSGLETTFAAEVDDLGEVLFCHGSPRSDEEVITLLSPPERLRDALRVRQHTIVCGHTHMQFQRNLGNHYVVNAGSVGMPYEGRPGAYWALLGPRVDLRRTDYNVDAAVDAMERTTCPHVQEVFIDTILHPPSADDVARQFEAIALDKTY